MPIQAENFEVNGIPVPVADAQAREDIARLNSSLTQYPNHGTASNVTFTNNKYTVPHSGVITGYFRKTTNATAGYVGIKSSITNTYRYFSSLTTSGEFSQINILVFGGEVLTYEESEILSSVLQFIPFTST